MRIHSRLVGVDFGRSLAVHWLHWAAVPSTKRQPITTTFGTSWRTSNASTITIPMKQMPSEWRANAYF